MRLSVALRMGSLLVAKPQGGDVRACAISMANLATNGYQAVCLDDIQSYSNILLTYPWLVDCSAICPICSNSLTQNEIMWHPFDHHVISQQMTIEQLADWIASIEPQELEARTENEQTEAVEVFV